MYLWKFWRDTRTSVYIYLGILIFFAIFWFIGMHIVIRSPRASGDPAFLWAADLAAAFSTCYLCALVMSFAVGNSGVGNDIGRGSAGFLLTRPVSRKYVAWAGWIAGISEVLGLVVITALVILGSVILATGPVWHQLPSAFRFEVERQVLDVPLMALTVILMPLVLLGLTYFLSIVLRGGSRGIVWSLAVVFAYQILSALLRQIAGISLPGMNFAGHPNAINPWYLTPRFEIVCWTVLALAFPLAAQITLERSEV